MEKAHEPRSAKWRKQIFLFFYLSLVIMCKYQILYRQKRCGAPAVLTSTEHIIIIQSYNHDYILCKYNSLGTFSRFSRVFIHSERPAGGNTRGSTESERLNASILINDEFRIVHRTVHKPYHMIRLLNKL